MKKRLLSLALSFVMLLTVLPVSVWAEEELAIPGEAPDVVSYEAEDVFQTTALPSADMDNDELFMGYLYSKALENEVDSAPAAAKSEDGFFVAHPAMMGFSRASTLTEPTKSVYVEIVPEIKKVASGESHSTEIKIYPQLLRRKYTAAELKVDYISQDASDSAYQLFINEYKSLVESIDVSGLISGLLADMPYELYWYDKTENGGADVGFGYSGEFGDYSQIPGYQYVEGGIPTSVTYYAYYTIKLAVAKSYRANIDNKYTTRDDLTLATDVPETVKTIVAEHAGETDAQKLRSYLNAVCSRVTYNSTAAENTSTPYGDPWQLIYVFDDDDNNTNVVCEGYAKAFKFLCDLSKWNDPDFDCYLATGQMNGGTGEGPHMWNIVHIRDANNPNGGNFMVDPTNCDEGSAGYPDKLFMKAPTKRDKDGKYHFAANSQSREIVYTYGDTTRTTFTADELTLAEKDYEQPAIDQSTGLRYRVVTGGEWVDGNYLAQVDAEIRSDLALSADRGKNVQIGFLNSNGTFTVLSADDLKVLGDVKLNAGVSDEEDQPCLWLVPYAPYAGGTITYHNEADGKDYTMNVPVRLPDVGFYSEAQRDKGHFKEELVFKNDPAQDVAYLFWPTDAMLISVEKSKWCTVDYEIENKDSMAKDGFAKIVLKSYGSGFAEFDVKYQQAGKEPTSGSGSLSLEMGVPALGYVDGYWDGEAFWPWGDAAYSLFLSPYYSSDIQVVFFDGERTTPVSLKDLTYHGVTLAALDESGTYIRLNSGVNDGSISYQKDGKTYTLPVTVRLPDVGIYSSSSATKETFLSSYKYTGNEDEVYLFWPADATLISVEKQEGCTVDYEIENKDSMAKDGYAKILLKSFGDGYVNLIVNYQQGDKPSNDYASLSLQMGAPCLGYKYLDWDPDSDTFSPREDVNYNLSLTANSGNYIQVVYFDGERPTPVSLQDLQFNGIEAKIEQNDNTYLLVKPEGVNDGSITYHNEADNENYTMKVSVQLPDVGYYSSSSATKETFLSSFDYKGDNNMVYLVWRSDVTLISVKKPEWCTAEYEIQNEDKMAEDHYAAISLHSFDDSLLSLQLSLLYPNRVEPFDNNFDLTIRDMSPGLRLVSKWDNETNQPAANATVWARFTMQPQGARRIQLAFFDGERYQPLTPEDVTTTNVIFYTSEDGYLWLAAPGIDDGTISYPKDGKIYTMEIPVQLPDVWFYSSPVASKDTYLNSWVYDGTDETETIYLVATNGYQITELPTLLEGSRDATLSKDGTYVTIQLTGAQDDIVESLLLSASLRKGNVRVRELYFDICYSNLTANLELPQGIEGTGYWMKAILRDKDDGQPVNGVKWTKMDSNRWLFNYTKPGDYLLEITWRGCVTRTVPVTVGEGTASVTVPLCAIGNINGAVNEQGKVVDASDMQCLFAYLSQGTIDGALKDDETYFCAVADVNEDGYVNILDYQALYEMVKTAPN